MDLEMKKIKKAKNWLVMEDQNKFMVYQRNLQKCK